MAFVQLVEQSRYGNQKILELVTRECLRWKRWEGSVRASSSAPAYTAYDRPSEAERYS